MAPLLAAGALERSNVPAGVPDFFVDQLFFPYAEGLPVRPGGGEEGRLGRNRPDVAQSSGIDGGDPPRVSVSLAGAQPAAGEPRGLAPGQRLAYTDTIGEWTIRFLLARALPEEEAAAAASGWRGDRIAYYVAGLAPDELLLARAIRRPRGRGALRSGAQEGAGEAAGRHARDDPAGGHRRRDHRRTAGEGRRNVECSGAFER